MTKDSPRSKVYQALSLIPKGKITTYGDLAEFAGLGKAARFVGTTLKNLPHDSSLPWHRVVNSKGMISFPENHPCYKKQINLLENDGVLVVAGKIDMKMFRWKP